MDIKGYDPANPYAIAPDEDMITVAAEEQTEYKTIPQTEKALSKIKKEMEKAARDLDFMEAARLRDEMFLLKKQLDEMKKWRETYPPDYPTKSGVLTQANFFGKVTRENKK